MILRNPDQNKSEPYIFVFFQGGGGPDHLSPSSGSAHDKNTIKVKQTALSITELDLKDT